MSSPITIAIVAKDAASTIKRAVLSAMAAGDYPVLLVDDSSGDDTVAIAKKLAGDQLTVIQNTGTGVAAGRQSALDAITTPYGMWLDADDEILPVRPSLFRDALEAGADLVFDSGRLVDGITGEDKGLLDIPTFIRDPRFVSRCIERNWYPLLHAGFRTGFARKVGYDASFRCAEDYDFLLRAIVAEAQISNLSAASYRYYHFADSISRNVTETRAHVRRALEKHRPQDWEAHLARAGIGPQEQAVVLASSALYKGNSREALAYLSGMEGADGLLPQYGLNASVMTGFLTATAHMLDESWQAALEELRNISRKTQSSMPEVLNNTGVCLAQLGDVAAGRSLVEEALQRKPGYYDALGNLKNPDTPPVHITTHPFRRQISRDCY